MDDSSLVKEDRRHSLDPLSADEVKAAIHIVRTQGPISDHMRFVSVNLHEPAKTEIENNNPGNIPDLPDRRAFIIVLDLAGRRVLEVLVSLLDEKLLTSQER